MITILVDRRESACIQETARTHAPKYNSLKCSSHTELSAWWMGRLGFCCLGLRILVLTHEGQHLGNLKASVRLARKFRVRCQLMGSFFAASKWLSRIQEGEEKTIRGIQQDTSVQKKISTYLRWCSPLKTSGY